VTEDGQVAVFAGVRNVHREFVGGPGGKATCVKLPNKNNAIFMNVGTNVGTSRTY
jgi:hypothetical protein